MLALPTQTRNMAVNVVEKMTLTNIQKMSTTTKTIENTSYFYTWSSWVYYIVRHTFQQGQEREFNTATLKSTAEKQNKKETTKLNCEKSKKNTTMASGNNDAALEAKWQAAINSFYEMFDKKIEKDIILMVIQSSSNQNAAYMHLQGMLDDMNRAETSTPPVEPSPEPVPVPESTVVPSPSQNVQVM